MTDNINQFHSVLSQQIENHEGLTEYLGKASALIQFALSEDFLDHPRTIIHTYLWTLSDVIEKAKELSEHILETLLKTS